MTNSINSINSNSRKEGRKDGIEGRNSKDGIQRKEFEGRKEGRKGVSKAGINEQIGQ